MYLTITYNGMLYDRLCSQMIVDFVLVVASIFIYKVESDVYDSYLLYWKT